MKAKLGKKLLYVFVLSASILLVPILFKRGD